MPEPIALLPGPPTLRRELGLLSEAEMAEIAGVEPRTVQDWRTQRIGPPYVKIGKTVLYPVEAFRRWVAENVKHGE